MTPSNTHPGTAARGLRRAFLLQAAGGLLAALLAAPAPALAQPDVIHFSVVTSHIHPVPGQGQWHGSPDASVPPGEQSVCPWDDPERLLGRRQYVGRQYLYVRAAAARMGT